MTDELLIAIIGPPLDLTEIGRIHRELRAEWGPGLRVRGWQDDDGNEHLDIYRPAHD